MKPVRDKISRAKILELIQECLGQEDHWARMRIFGRAAEYQSRADVLIGLLEVDDCGSYGGYDSSRGQPSVSTLPGSERLRARFEWLKSLPTKVER